jgi:hypothetical protein
MEDWNEAIFAIIKNYNKSEIELNEIYQIMKTHRLVTEYHRQPWKPSGQPRYECWIRRCLTSLIRANLIKRVSRALYALR